MNFKMFKLVFKKAEESEIKLPTSAGSLKKQESSRKTSISGHSGTPVSGMQPGAVQGAGCQEKAEGLDIDVWDGHL